MPTEVNLETLNLNDEFESHMSKQLAAALQLKEEAAHALVMQREEELPPAERVRRYLFNLVIESVPLSSEEVSYIVS